MLSPRLEPTDEMLADIRGRLARVCQSYSADEFSELVRRIALLRAKYDALSAESFFDAVRIVTEERRRRNMPTGEEPAAEPLR